MDTNRKVHQKVVWSEGMLLTPHHFQQWDRYYEHLLAGRFRAASPFAWGVTKLDFDHHGIGNGRFTLLAFDGVMPDGLVVRVPEQDDPPETVLFSDLFTTAKDRLNVYLGIPIERTDGMNCRLDSDSGSKLVRYNAEDIQPVDTTTGSHSRPVAVAKKNLRIFFSGQETNDTVPIKIAELVRTSSGTIDVREAYIPPCLWISASRCLLGRLRGLIELLKGKRDSFSDAQRGTLEIVGTDLGKFALVNAISTALPMLTHICQVEKVHPEVLYATMAQLVGQLMILAPSTESQEIPAYQHENLACSFEGLDEKIQRIIGERIPDQCIPIPLESSGLNVLVGRVPESRLFASAQFFLTVAGEMSEDQMRTLIPQHIKIGSPSKLKAIVRDARSGIRLYHTPRPPVTLPMRQGTQYFRVDDRDTFWDEIKKSQVLALHVPENLQSLSIQLVAVKE